MKPSSTPLIKHIPDFLDYIDVEKGLSSKTQENYGRFLDRFVSWLKTQNLEGLLPHQLTEKHLWDYRVFLARATRSRQTKLNLKKATQNYYLIALRGLLSYLTDKDILSLPADKLKLSKQKKEKSVHFLNLAQVKSLLDSPDTSEPIGLRDRAILEVLFSTGLRVAELGALNREQIKITPNSKFLEITVVGKGSHPRPIYFSERALHWLKKYLDKREDMDPALFINYKEGASERRLTVRSVENIVKKYVKMAGLPIMTTPHTLRHSYATDLLNQGVDLRLVQEFLGHQDISTTQIYTHVTNKKLRDVYLKHHSGNKA